MLDPRPFFFLRHGETDWNRENRVLGQTDIPLNDRGIAQAGAAQALLAASGIDVICCSPLRRARETAEIVNEALRCPVIVIDDLKEASFGSREGHPKGPWYSDWERGMPPPGGEDRPAFIERALRGVNAALAHGGLVLIVAHGGTYAAIRQYASVIRDGEMPNCTPVRHDPPVGLVSQWAVTMIGAPLRLSC